MLEFPRPALAAAIADLCIQVFESFADSFQLLYRPALPIVYCATRVRPRQMQLQTFTAGDIFPDKVAQVRRCHVRFISDEHANRPIVLGAESMLQIVYALIVGNVLATVVQPTCIVRDRHVCALCHSVCIVVLAPSHSNRAPASQSTCIPALTRSITDSGCDRYA